MKLFGVLLIFFVKDEIEWLYLHNIDQLASFYARFLLKFVNLNLIWGFSSLSEQLGFQPNLSICCVFGYIGDDLCLYTLHLSNPNAF